MIPAEQRRHHDRIDPHRGTQWLASVVLGGQDGLVNVLGVILGVAAATGDKRIVLVAGVAAAFAESVSMAAVAYTSEIARGEHFQAERRREYRHIETVPELERDEVRAIYARKGFDGELLDRIVATITRDKDVWVAVMMTEEHGLADVDRAQSARAAVIVGVSAIIGSLLPLVPFLILSVTVGTWVSIVGSALLLFAFGAFKSNATVGHPIRGGVELALIGTASALAGYLVGVWLHLPAATP